MQKKIVNKFDVPYGCVNIDSLNPGLFGQSLLLKAGGKLYPLQITWARVYFEGYTSLNWENWKPAVMWGMERGEMYCFDSLRERENFIASSTPPTGPTAALICKDIYVLLRNDLKGNTRYGNTFFNEVQMLQGKIVQISKRLENGKEFNIYGDDRPYFYTPEMVRELITLKTGMKVRLTESARCFSKGSVITISQLNNDGTITGYENDHWHTHEIPVTKLELIPEFQAGEYAILSDATGTGLRAGQEVKVTGKRYDGDYTVSPLLYQNVVVAPWQLSKKQ